MMLRITIQLWCNIMLMRLLWKYMADSALRLVRNIETFLPRVKTVSDGAGKRFAIGCGLALGLGWVQAIEDEAIRNMRGLMNRQISALKSQYGQTTVYPEVRYQLRGDNYEVIFEIDQRKCDLFSVIATYMGVYNADRNFRVLDTKVFTSNNITTFYIDFEENDPKFKTPQKGRITLTGVMTNERPNFRLIFNKDAAITDKNLKALAAVYREAVKPKKVSVNAGEQGWQKQGQAPPKKKKGNQLYEKLGELGLTVFDPNEKSVTLDWDCLAGYETQKRLIQDTVLLALNYPQIYDEITQQTRVKYEPNRPKAVLFEGPPGTGKTTSAKIIAQQVNIPLIYIPTEAIMSKFYGESETKLASMWELCEKLGRVIIFIDEIDALAGNRSTDMHEASRRILSTLLRKIDSFESSTNVLLICATNRKADLDPAMLSRIDLAVTFHLPDKHSRAAIFRRYAKHLSDSQLQALAGETENFSGRNISDICKNAERRWASKLIRRETSEKLPNLQEYMASLEERRANQLA